MPKGVKNVNNNRRTNVTNSAGGGAGGGQGGRRWITYSGSIGGEWHCVECYNFPGEDTANGC